MILCSSSLRKHSLLCGDFNCWRSSSTVRSLFDVAILQTVNGCLGDGRTTFSHKSYRIILYGCDWKIPYLPSPCLCIVCISLLNDSIVLNLKVLAIYYTGIVRRYMNKLNVWVYSIFNMCNSKCFLPIMVVCIHHTLRLFITHMTKLISS